jgi:hypothetical protein
VTTGLKCAAKLTFDPKRRQRTGLQTYTKQAGSVRVVPRHDAPSRSRPLGARHCEALSSVIAPQAILEEPDDRLYSRLPR